jgi:hypothetical protein
MSGDNLQYKYHTDWHVPYALNTTEAFQKEYEVGCTGRVGYTVSFTPGNSKTRIRMWCGATCSDPLNHNPEDLATHAPELWPLFYRLCISLSLLKDYIPELGTGNISLHLAMRLPSVGHDFYEMARDHGVDVRKLVSAVTSLSTSWNSTLSVREIDELHSLVEGLYRESEQNGDQGTPRLTAAENYVYGLVCPDNPYFFWRRVLETLRNPDFNVVKVGSGNEDSQNIEFLADIANYHCHSLFNKSYDEKREQAQKKYGCLLKNPEQLRAKYMRGLKRLTIEFLVG